MQKLGGNSTTKMKFKPRSPIDFIPDPIFFAELCNTINIKKPFGGDNIPLELINIETGRIKAYEELKQTLKEYTPHSLLFQARLVRTIKLKSDDIPTLDDIRSIAITELLQKLTEKAILHKIDQCVIPEEEGNFIPCKHSVQSPKEQTTETLYDLTLFFLFQSSF